MKKTLMIGGIVLLLAGWAGLHGESTVAVAHVTYLDGPLAVAHLDGSRYAASINLPVVVGDVLTTDDGGRAEIQLGNGTLVRIDRGSEVRVGTLLAPLLSSADWRVTTLELKRGAAYILGSTYSHEMLQVVSDDVAVKFPRHANIEIGIVPESGTRVASHWGAADLLFTGDNGQERGYTLKAGTAVTVNKAGKLAVGQYAREGEFLAWNRSVDDRFDQLHRGKSVVPAKIVRNPSLQDWAEKWSCVYGEWVYDRIFGYIWKPGGDFAVDPDKRPFFNGAIVKINGVEYVVPDQPWGWAPAHLGTWVFMKKWGWTWIPGQGDGDIFSAGTQTLMDWIWLLWGSPFGYDVYLSRGLHAWEDYYFAEYGTHGDVDPDRAPPSVRFVLHKLELAQPHWAKDSLVSQRDDFVNKGQVRQFLVERAKITGNPGNDGTVSRVTGTAGADSAARTGQAVALRHDWNPDRQWASQHRVQLLYSSQSNSVVVPQKSLDSATITHRERELIARDLHGHESSGSDGSNSQGSAADSGSSANASSGSSVKDIK